MPRTFSTGIEVPSAGDRHPSEQWWSRTGSTTNAAIERMDSSNRAAWAAAVAALRSDSVSKADASKYGIPGPPNALSVGTVQGGVTAAASITGTAPSQILNLTLPQGPRGPEGPGGAFQMRETADAGLFEVSDVPNAALQASAEVAVRNVTTGAMLSRGIAPAGADLNTYRGPDQAGVWELAASRSYVNSPIPNTAAGLLIVSTQRSIAYQRVIQHGVPAIWERSSLSSSTWNPWNALPVSQPAAGISLDDLRANQELTIRNNTDALAVTGGWPDALGIPRVAARISVRATTTGLIFQQMQTYGTDPRFLVRSTASTSPTPYPFSAWRDLTAPAPAQTASASDAGLANALLLQDFTRRRPVIKTGGKPAVALRFDHGLGNFRDNVVPALKRLNIPAAQALNGGDWDRTENDGVTAAQVNTWVEEGWLEVWNHSLNHVAPPASEADLEAQVKGGLDKLRADLPAAVIDGYAPPGSSGDTTGFDGGGSIESWWNTAPGRAILSTHAVGSGYLDGTVYRTLDGEVRQGQSHYTVDTLTLDTMKARVTNAYTGARGVALMLHPSRLDTEGYLSSADFVAFLEWLAAERDAGRVAVLGYYDLLRADSRL